MIRDITLGRLALVTIDGDLGEDVGDSLEPVGRVAVPGDATPRAANLTLPVSGASNEADPSLVGDRMRRQVRSMMNNTRLRREAVYLANAFDGELSGWLHLGRGELTYAEEGGVAFGDYKLVLADTFYAGKRRTHRPARRPWYRDRRLSTTPRDVEKRVYATLWAAVANMPLAVLPYGLSDLTRNGVPSASVSKATAEGPVSLVTGIADGDVLSYEVAEGSRNKTDVVLYDRRGNLAGTPLVRSEVGFTPIVNLVTNPSIETDASGYTAVNGAAISRSTAQALRGSASLLVDPDQAGSPNVASGATYTGLTTVIGTTYSMLVAVRCSVARQVTLRFQSGNDSKDSAAVSLSANQWTWLRVENFTPTLSGNPGFRIVPTGGAWGTETLHMDCFMLVQGATVGEYVDGDQPGCSWDGTPHASTSRQTGKVNRVTNPSAELDLTNITSGTNTGDWTVTVPLERRNAWASAGEYSGYIKLTKGATATASSWSVRFGGTTRFPVTGGAAYTAQVAVNVLDAPATGVRIRAVWRDSGGGALGADYSAYKTTTGEGSLTLTVTAPANAVECQIYTEIDSSSASDVAELYVDAAQLIAESSASDYFDGDSVFGDWSDTPHASASAYGADPQTALGWEEVYGEDWASATWDGSDAPVLDNGVCRVRYRTLNGWHVFAVDQWVAGSGWVERGALFPHAAGTSVSTAAGAFRSARVIEWTPERAVVKARMVNGNGYVIDIYLILQRGWSGPRVEVYNRTGGGVGAGVIWEPNASGIEMAAQMSGWTITSSEAWTSNIDMSVAAEPWVALVPLSGTFPRITIASQIGTTHSLLTLGNYGANDRGLALYGQSSGAYWGGWEFQIGGGQAVTEAEAVRYASGTTSQVADGAASGGQTVQETQAAETNNTLRWAGPATIGRTYLVAMRVRVGTAGATISVRPNSGVSGAVQTSTSTTYVWLVQALTASSVDVFINIWRSAGTGNVFIDRVILLELASTALDGARDFGAQALADTRMIQELVTR